MVLEFTKEGNKWIANAEVTADFNLHVEKGQGVLTVAQSTVSGGGYDAVNSLFMEAYERVVDRDVTALVWPKYLRFVASTEEAPIVTITYNA